MTRCIKTAVVDSNKPLCAGHFRLALRVDAFPDCAPGQFINILCQRADAPSAAAPADGGAGLRRPFSIAEIARDADGVRLDVLHHVVGAGTAWMAQRAPGDAVSIVGPLGRPFAIPDTLRRAVLVGGGIGIPPLIWLSRVLAERNIDTTLLYGVRSREALPLALNAAAMNADAPLQPSPCLEPFAAFGASAVVCTDDGSVGHHGFVTDALATGLPAMKTDANTMVFTCGPDVMMRRVAALCRENGVACQACLERLMACGLGTCQSCVVPVRDASRAQGWRYRLCCSDGPAFDAAAVCW